MNTTIQLDVTDETHRRALRRMLDAFDEPTRATKLLKDKPKAEAKSKSKSKPGSKRHYKPRTAVREEPKAPATSNVADLTARRAGA